MRNTMQRLREYENKSTNNDAKEIFKLLEDILVEDWYFGSKEDKIELIAALVNRGMSS